ncbi:hypothetical protein K435DRAFT_880552 [Dendrothele bispora CBS 962.96]|uniref:Uncharacterized protein n=1 Tax=Dendrothele bispora (strain CBS 962.96) TaxID=1314807 RepID=A0A4S8KJA4_DENBC|nr:hypothetical protein K435DRAFT_880552 [Dendrothele bispora CBS 962.96]
MSQTRSPAPSSSQTQTNRPNLRSQLTTENPKKKIKEAEAYLVKHNYLDSDGSASSNRSMLYNALGTIANTEKRDFTTHYQVYADAIKHVVTLLKAIDDENTNQEISNAVNDAFNTLNVTSQMEEKLNSIHAEISDKFNKLAQGIESRIQSSAGTQPRTYAEAALTQMPPAKLSPELNRQRLRSHVQAKNRQLLFRVNPEKPPILSEPDTLLSNYADPDIITLFNKSLREIGAPEDIEFVTISKYKNTNNLLTEMNTPTAAKWLNNIVNSVQFETSLNASVDLIQREYGLAINFVPVWFNPQDNDDLRELESYNDLPACSITKARWANGTKDGKKNPNQLSATLLIKLNDPDVANEMIVKEIRIKGK